MNYMYSEQQQSQLVQVCGLQKFTQKLELCVNLEMVDVCLHFGINCIRVNGDSAIHNYLYIAHHIHVQ